MKFMVVLFAIVAVACSSNVPLAQPPHLPAIVLEPHGRPLETAEVINSRALHLQAKILEGHYLSKRSAVVAPVIAHGGIVPVAHGNYAHINHAAIAPIAQPAAVPAYPLVY